MHGELHAAIITYQVNRTPVTKGVGIRNSEQNDVNSPLIAFIDGIDHVVATCVYDRIEAVVADRGSEAARRVYCCRPTCAAGG